MNGHEMAGEFITSIRWEDLPAEVQRKARMCLLDDLGAVLAGTLTRISRISAEVADELWPGNAASIMRREPDGRLYTTRANMAGAAFANGNTANAIDIDDSARYAYGHAGASLFPTVLAAGEALNRTGAELLAALVAGYEVAHRVGRCWHDHHEVYQACGSWGSVACAAAAAHLMRLSPDQAGHALGIAEYHSPNLPMMRDIAHPAMVKHGIGWAAMNGIVSATLASRGYTGIPGILSFPEYEEWACDIGAQYLMVEGVAWKAERYACCGWAHAGVEGARRLVRDNQLDVACIDRIEVAGSHNMVCLGVALPTTTEEAQFNLAWPLAAMIVDGEIGPTQMLEQRLRDPAVAELAGKVEVVEDAELEELCTLFEKGDPRGRFASRVTIIMHDGRELSSGLVDGGLRFPQPGWDERRVEDKFRWAAGFVLDEPNIDALVDSVWRFEQVSSVREFVELVN